MTSLNPHTCQTLCLDQNASVHRSGTESLLSASKVRSSLKDSLYSTFLHAPGTLWPARVKQRVTSHGEVCHDIGHSTTEIDRDWLGEGITHLGIVARAFRAGKARSNATPTQTASQCAGRAGVA